MKTKNEGVITPEVFVTDFNAFVWRCQKAVQYKGRNQRLQ